MFPIATRKRLNRCWAAGPHSTRRPRFANPSDRRQGGGGWGTPLKKPSAARIKAFLAGMPGKGNDNREEGFNREFTRMNAKSKRGNFRGGNGERARESREWTRKYLSAERGLFRGGMKGTEREPAKYANGRESI
jgi:hypothetical protein